MLNRFFIILSAFLAGSCTSNIEEIEMEVQPPYVLSDAEEMNVWIYQQMKHYYLWNKDIPDSIECDFSLIPTEFFKSILSSKDRFSYMQSNSRNSRNLGFAYQSFKRTNGEIIHQILYVTSNQAKACGLKRGDFVKIKDYSGNKVVLEILPLWNSQKKSMEITYEVNSNNDTNPSVLLDSVYTVSNKQIGYLCYLEYGQPEDFLSAFKNFKNKDIDELVLDLRYNPGGLVSTCRKLCSLIVPSTAYGNLFQQNSYNDIVSIENLQLYGNERTFSYFEAPNTDNVPTLGLKYDFLNLKKVYILTSSHTASASESTIYCLKPYMDVTTIGSTTVGKGVGMQTISSNKYKYALVPITFRYYNSKDETVPDAGIIPDYIMEDSYFTPKSEIGDTSEPLLSKALELIVPSYRVARKISSTTIKEYSLTPIGEPSYVTEFNNKQYNESN